MYTGNFNAIDLPGGAHRKRDPRALLAAAVLLAPLMIGLMIVAIFSVGHV